MNQLSATALNSIDKLIKNSLFKKVLTEESLNSKQKYQAASFFYKIKLKKHDVKHMNYILRFTSTFFIGRFFISLLLPQIALKSVSDILKTYQKEKIIGFSNLLDSKDGIALNKSERKNLLFLIKHSPLQDAIKNKIRKRAWKRWKARSLPKKIFNKIYPQKINLENSFLSDNKLDRFLVSHIDYIEVEEKEETVILASEKVEAVLASDNAEILSCEILDERSEEPLGPTSDNCEGAEILSGENLDERYEEPLNPSPDNFENAEIRLSQSLPYYMSSIDDFLSFLHKSGYKDTIITNLSHLAACYTSKSLSEQQKKENRYKQIFYEWSQAFQVAYNSPKEQNKDDFHIDFSWYPQIKPFVPLLEYVPTFLKSYKKIQLKVPTLNQVKFEDLSILLNYSTAIGKSNESRIASILLPLLNQLMDNLQNKLDNLEERQEWLEYCKENASTWDSFFYKKLLDFAENADWIVKPFLKTRLKNYTPILHTLNKRLQSLPKAYQECRRIAYQKMIKEKELLAGCEKELISLHQIGGREQILKCEEEICISKRYILYLEEYQESQWKEKYHQSEVAIKKAISWESSKEAQALDKAVGRIYNDIFKPVLLSWIDKHSVGKFISCIKIYRKIYFEMQNLLKNADVWDHKEKSASILKLKSYFVEMIISIFKEMQIYNSEMMKDETEKRLFLKVSSQLAILQYDDDNHDYVHQTWKKLIAPLLEDILQVSNLF